MKQAIKIYLEPQDKKALLEKAEKIGFVGRGALTKFIQKMARDEVCFLDDNLKKMLKVLFPPKK